MQDAADRAQYAGQGATIWYRRCNEIVTILVAENARWLTEFITAHVGELGFRLETSAARRSTTKPRR